MFWNRNLNCRFILIYSSAAVMFGCASTGQNEQPQVLKEAVKQACTHHQECGVDAYCSEGMCKQYSATSCDPLPAAENGVCRREGSGSRIVLRGDIVGVDGITKGGSIVVENGRITYVGCSPDMANSVVITCPESVISPAFINGHEHLTYSNATPADWSDERFSHRNEWRKGANGHTKVKGPRTKHNETVEIRSLMSGTTSIFGSGRVPGLARNIDEENIEGVRSVYQTFPLGDSGDGVMRDSDCNYDYHDSVLDIDSGCPYGPHIGEGISDAARNEIRCLGTDGPHTIFRDNLAMIHGVAASPSQIAEMSKKHVKLIWSPRSNISLYGDTAMVPVYDRLGVEIGFGTDWIYSGSATMLRELACADTLNRDYYDGYFSDYDLWRMPTWNNAEAFGLSHVLGDLKKGYIADIVIFRRQEGKSLYRSVISAENKDIQLVMMDGNFVYGDDVLMEKGEAVDVCGVSKKIDLAVTGTEVTFSEALKNAAYDMFFCTIPSGEPSCIPARTRPEDTASSTRYDGFVNLNGTDRDGDGIPDENDNCPTVFNPIRPLDHGIQSDFDGDGIGDICDPNPLCAENMMSCPVIAANDYDEDGVDNSSDNCPYMANPEQTDSDGDGKGDACDSCPNEANPGEQRCTLTTQKTIREVNDSIRQTCTNLKAACRIQEEIKVSGRVTMVSSHGFFMQMPDAGDVSGTGIYVVSSGGVEAGDDVTVQGYPGLSSGMPIMARPEVQIVSKKQKAIEPTEVRISDILVDGEKARLMTGVLISVKKAVVQAHDSQAAYGMYLVKDESGSSMYVDDFVWTISPVPEEGKVFERVTGVLVYDFGNYKIAPSGESDMK